MAIPGQTITIRDPGLGLVSPAITRPLILGVCTAGTPYTMYEYATLNDAQTGLGQGPLSEAVCTTLARAGGPVLCMPVTTDAAGVMGAVTKHAAGASTGTVTLAGIPSDAYRLRIYITATGALGAAQFQYSLDGGTTRSQVLLVPAGGVYAIPSSNVTATFVPGGGPVIFLAGDWHESDGVASHFTTVSLGTAITAVLLDRRTFSFIALAGRPATAAAAAAMFGAMTTHLTSLETVYRYVRSVMDAGIDSAAGVRTAFGALEDRRQTVVYSTNDIASAKPFAGWGTPRLPLAHTVCGEAAAQLISTDLARVLNGSLQGVTEIQYDEYKTPGLDDIYNVTTSRTWPGRTGFFLTNCKLKSPVNSDYRYWQHGRVMDTACTVVATAQQTFIAMGLRANADGTIDERDARRLETVATEALRTELTQPKNVEGTQGHVSALSYKIDRTNNMVSTETLLAEVAIRPLGYPKFIRCTIGFALKV